jgi:hypothetical protein
MLVLIRRILSYKFFPVCWTILIIILLCLPGSLVPGGGIFDFDGFDKLVHTFLFGMNVLFWGWHYGETDRPTVQLKKIFILSVTLSIILGIILEFVQLYFIPNRSFDGTDIIADMVGAIIAGIWLLRI